MQHTCLLSNLELETCQNLFENHSFSGLSVHGSKLSCLAGSLLGSARKCLWDLWRPGGLEASECLGNICCALHG